jgi:hypothetical protein
METNEMLNTQTMAPPKPSVSVKIDQVETPARSRLGSDFMKLMPVLVDVVLVMLAFEIGRQIDALFSNTKSYPWPSASIYTAMLVISMYLNEMYAFWQQRNTAELITSIMRSMGLSLILVAPVLYLFPGLIEPVPAAAGLAHFPGTAADQGAGAAARADHRFRRTRAAHPRSAGDEGFHDL